MKPRWIELGLALVGTKEQIGPSHNPLIVRMWEAIKAPFRDDETPWCAAFVGSMLEQSGIRSTRSAAARSYETWGTAAPPVVGAVVVFSRPGNAWSGHVGFLVGRDTNDRLMILGGNQGNAVSIAPFTQDRVLAFRWPAGVSIPGEELPLFATGRPASQNEA